MIVHIILGIILFSIWIGLYVSLNERYKKKYKYPPGPFQFPFVGGLIQIVYAAGFQGQHHERVHRIAQKYGKVCTVIGGSQHGVVVEDFDAAKEILSSSDWSSRFPSHPRFKEHLLFQNLGVMWSDGEPHREMRRFTIRTLKTFGFGELKSAEMLLGEEFLDFCSLLDKKRSEAEDDEVLMHHTFKIPTFNILWLVMAGYRFSNNDSKIAALIDAVDDISRINIGLDPEWAFPLLRYIPGCSPSRAKKPSFVICHEFFHDIIRERRKTMTFMDTQHDFIDYFLKKIEEERGNPNTIYTDDQFAVTCVDLLFGGLDTTANSIEFAVLYLVKYPWIQKKAQQELDIVVGHDRIPTLADRLNLRYCEAVYWETLRFANIVPCNGRTSNKETKIGNYNIEKDVFAGIINTSIHMDEDTWGDPQVFRPQRFLDDNGNFINTDKVIAFGGGKRLCPGQSMAKVIWMVFITGMLQKYSLLPSPTHPELSIVPVAGVANTPKPFYCLVKPRTF